jgi:hypothetical protein
MTSVVLLIVFFLIIALGRNLNFGKILWIWFRELLTLLGFNLQILVNESAPNRLIGFKTISQIKVAIPIHLFITKISYVSYRYPSRP